MRELDEELVHQLLVANGPRDQARCEIWWELRHEVLPVEPTEVLPTSSSRHRRHVVDVGIVYHRGDRCIRVMGLELAAEMSLPDLDHRALTIVQLSHVELRLRRFIRLDGTSPPPANEAVQLTSDSAIRSSLVAFWSQQVVLTRPQAPLAPAKRLLRWAAAVRLGNLSVFGSALLLLGCATPEGPRLPLPTQDLRADVPEGYARVVFFNDSNEVLYFESGNIRVQLDGKSAPSLYLNHYAQLFLQPGEYELLLEHFDVFTFTDRYDLTISGREVFIRIWCTPVSTKFQLVDELPEDFTTHYTGGRDLKEWPEFEAMSRSESGSADP